MKKILIFIGLKIAEIIGVCLVPVIIYSTGLFMTYRIGWHADRLDILDIAFKGFAVYAGGFIMFLVSIGAYKGIKHAIKANWDWADRIARKK